MGLRAVIHQVKDLTANLHQITAHTGSDHICMALGGTTVSGLGAALTCQLRGLKAAVVGHTYNPLETLAGPYHSTKAGKSWPNPVLMKNEEEP